MYSEIQKTSCYIKIIKIALININEVTLKKKPNRYLKIC